MFRIRYLDRIYLDQSTTQVISPFHEGFVFLAKISEFTVTYSVKIANSFESSTIKEGMAYSGECSGSVIECLTRDQEVAGLSLTGGTVHKLCP